VRRITGGKGEVGEKIQKLMVGSGMAKIEEERCGDGGSTKDRASAVRFRGGGGVLVARVQEGGEEVARKLLRIDVVLGASSVRAERGAERRDNGEVKRRQWTGLPARRSGGVSMSGWRRTGLRALVGCSGAGGARDCRGGAVEVADDGEQRQLRRFGGRAERRTSRGAKCGCVRG
jgi:hypothetical protein